MRILWTVDEDAQLRRWHNDENGCTHTYQWMADQLNSQYHGNAEVRTAAAVRCRDGYVNYGKPGRAAVDAPTGRPAVDSAGAEALRTLLSDACVALDAMHGALSSCIDRRVCDPGCGGMLKQAKSVTRRLRLAREKL